MVNALPHCKELPGPGDLILNTDEDLKAWHVGEGLAVQFLEREGEIKSIMPLSELDAPCTAWDKYQLTEYYVKDDSGL